MRVALSGLAVLVLTALSGFGSDRVPFNALRFGGNAETDENWPGLFEAIRKNAAAFEEVWFSTGTAFPPLEVHEARARLIARRAGELRAIGLTPSVEIQTMIGHGDRMFATADVRGAAWPRWVTWDGVTALGMPCPRAPELSAYFIRVAELQAAWKPASLWFDDDIRTTNRVSPREDPKASDGCFCERCLAAFSAEEGRTFDRAELVEALAGDAALRTRWDSFQCRSLGSLVKSVSAAVHRVSPETVVGFQYCRLIPEVVEGIFAGTGIPVRLRPAGGACYWDRQPLDILDKCYCLANAVDCPGLVDKVGARCPEIETCPRTFFCRTPQGVLVECFVSFACGMDFLSLFVASVRANESMDYYRDDLFPRLAAARPFLERFRAANRGAKPCGFSVPYNRPKSLVAVRGLPIVPCGGRSLGDLPDLRRIPARTAGSDWIGGYDEESRILQVMSGPDWMDFVRKADASAGGRTPALVCAPVRAFVLPNVRDDGTLATVAVLNASMDVQRPTDLLLRGVPATTKTVVWQTVEQGAVTMPAVSCEGGTKVRLPELAAWKFGFLSFEPSPDLQ